MSRYFLTEKRLQEIQRLQANGLMDPGFVPSYWRHIDIAVLEPTRRMARRWYWEKAPRTLPAGTTAEVPMMKTVVPINRAARRRAAAEQRAHRGWRSYVGS